MARDDAYLVDILDAAKLAWAYVSGKTKDEFDHDIQCQDAVIRRLEIIGERQRDGFQIRPGRCFRICRGMQ